MNYQDSICDFFRTDKWKSNLLLGAVCVLIPMIGQLVLAGWIITALWSRGDDMAPKNHPPFDFQHFTKYLMRGLWPFLIQLASLLVIMPFGLVMFFAIALAQAAFKNGDSQTGGILLACGMVLYVIVILGVNLLILPLSISAILSQDFIPAFRFAYLRHFIALMWKDMLMTFLFLFGVSIVLVIIMICTCYIGGFLLIPVVTFAWHHLQKQLYLLFVARGGEPLARSPKLSDLPPALPSAPVA